MAAAGPQTGMQTGAFIAEHEDGGTTPVQLPIRLHREIDLNARDERCHDLKPPDPGVLESVGQLFNPQRIGRAETTHRHCQDCSSGGTHHLRPQGISPGSHPDLLNIGCQCCSQQSSNIAGIL